MLLGIMEESLAGKLAAVQIHLSPAPLAGALPGQRGTQCGVRTLEPVSESQVQNSVLGEPDETSGKLPNNLAIPQFPHL